MFTIRARFSKDASGVRPYMWMLRGCFHADEYAVDNE
jgi:hypothetical protein